MEHHTSNFSQSLTRYDPKQKLKSELTDTTTSPKPRVIFEDSSKDKLPKLGPETKSETHKKPPFLLPAIDNSGYAAPIPPTHALPVPSVKDRVPISGLPEKRKRIRTRKMAPSLLLNTFGTPEQAAYVPTTDDSGYFPSLSYKSVLSESLKQNVSSEIDAPESPTSSSGETFFYQLFDMIEDPHYRHIIDWSPNGDTFVIKDEQGFKDLVLPNHFNNCNFLSFLQQLKMYGFFPTRGIIHGNPLLSADFHETQSNYNWQFSHPSFSRIRPKQYPREQAFSQRDSPDILATEMRLQALENDTLNFTLHRASQLGTSNVVKYLLDNGADIEHLDEDGLSPLFLAGQYPKIISILIRRGACRTARSKRHRCKDVLHHYASLNQTEGICSLLTHYYNIDLGDEDGKTALHYATKNGHKTAVELLINRGAAVDAKCDQMDTALHMAVRNGHQDILKLLHSHGADIDAKNNVLYTPLHIVAEIGGKDSTQRLLGHGNAKGQLSEIDGLQMVVLLLMLGAKIDAVDMNGQTPFIIAVKSNNLDMVSLLMNHGAKLEAADNDGLTAVHWSAKLGNVAALDLLLRNGAQAEARTIQGDTALHIATECNHCDAVDILLENGANIGAKNVKGKTPIQVAIMKRHIDIAYQLKNARAAIGTTEHKRMPMQSLTADVQRNESKTVNIDTVRNPDEMMVDINAALSTALRYRQFDIVSRLLDDGADIDTPNDDGLSPLFLAGQNPQLVSVLLHRGACMEARNQQNRNLTVLHYYVSLGQSEAICILLNCGCNIHSTDENDNTALHYSARKGDCEVAELLLAQGVDINAKNCRGETALHVALENEFFDLPNLLIDKSIDIDAKTFKLELTALHIAIETKNSKIISVLLKRHANVNAKNILGQTPLHLAVYSELEEACDQLIEHNANVNSMDKNNCTPLHAAVERCNPVLVKLLLKNGAFTNSSDYFDDPLSHAIKRFKRNTGHHLESRFTEVLTLLIKAGADKSNIQVSDAMETRLPSLISILAISPTSEPPSQKGKSNTASTTVEDYVEQSDFSDVVLTEFKENTSSENELTAVNKRHLLHIKHKYGYGWPVWKNLQLDAFIDNDNDMDISEKTDQVATLKLFDTIPIGERAIAIIHALFSYFDAKLFMSDHFFLLELQGRANKMPPKWASDFDKMRGIIREPGRLIVQVPPKETTLSVPAWHNCIHPYIRFIDALYVCRRSSYSVNQEAFADVLGGSEQELATDLHSILIAGLSILSIAGGDGLVEKLVMVILDIQSDSINTAPVNEVNEDWGVRKRRLCNCGIQPVHRPLSPVAAAKAIGIGIWRKRHKKTVKLVDRVWDVVQDKLVNHIDVTKVIFVTHKWTAFEVTYQLVMIRERSNGQTIGISKMSDKLRRIRESLRAHTQYVWIDTICVDKSNVSELDVTIRSMYEWYASCTAVVLDPGTSLNVWRTRGWCLLEGSAAGILCGISKNGNLTTIKQLAIEQHNRLCTLDLHLYYRPGNAAEILARMDVRKTQRTEDMAYALAGMFSIHLALTYGEGTNSRKRLYNELAIQKKDISFLSFQSTETTRTGPQRFLSSKPIFERSFHSIANCTVTSTPISVSRVGMCFHVQLVQGSDASYVLQRLSVWKHLNFSKGRSSGIDGLFMAAELLERQKSMTLKLAIVHEIKSIILMEPSNLTSQSDDGIPIKLYYQKGCCQIEENEFGRLFDDTKASFESIWLSIGL